MSQMRFGVLLLGFATCWLGCLIPSACSRDAATLDGLLATTVADVQAVHHGVTLLKDNAEERPIQARARLGVGDTLRTSEHGRARVQLDDGTLLVLDGGSRITVTTAGVNLESGRLFVESGRNAHTQLSFRDVETVVAGASISLRIANDGASVYCARGELVLLRDNGQTRLTSGETARVRADAIDVVPEVAFEDWTGGLAVPWSSDVGSRSAIPELRAVDGDADLGTPLIVRSHDVKVSISGEVAFTRATTTYFNGGAPSTSVAAHLALPNGAILTRVARNNPATTEASVAVADGPGVTSRAQVYGLEWAGDGYVSGDLGPIEAGQVLSLELEYVEWLPRGNATARDATRSYRYPLSANPALPPVGSVSFELEATHASARWVTASAGAMLHKTTPTRLTWRKSDFRPTADFVAEYTHDTPNTVRAYVRGELPSGGAEPSPSEAPYVLLRADLPEQPDTGLTLALVLDTSMSLGGAAFETSRAVVDALLSGLSSGDEVVVFTADQVVRSLGKPEPQPLTPQYRATLQSALASLRPGGASNLDAALRRAADALDAPGRGEKSGTGLVVYVGDGRPTLGVTDMAKMREGLLRRSSGLPRMSAIAVGAHADRWALARLMTGSGEVYEALDRADAARVGARLLASALQPTWRDVELELGTAFDRIYPRNPRAVIQGDTLTVVARLRGALPTHVGVRFRRGSALATEAVPLQRLANATFNDVSQRWALARIEEIAGSDGAIEPAIALAHEAKLLTPWTGWFFTAPFDGKGGRRFSDRVLSLSSDHDAAYGRHVDPVLTPGTLLLDPRRNTAPRVSIKEAADGVIRRVLRRAVGQVSACRQARAGANPGLALQFAASVTVDSAGHTTRAAVRSHDSVRRDVAIERCVEAVLRGLPQVATGVTVNLTHTFTLTENENQRPTQCSDVSRISLPLRKSVWRSRSLSTPGYIQASRGCELPRWRDKRAYLDLLLNRHNVAQGHLETAVELDDAGHADAAQYVRREALRRITDFEELHTLPAGLLNDEPALPHEFEESYAKAANDRQRLVTVKRFLPLAWHNATLRARLLYLLEALGHQEEMLALIRTIRGEAVVDARLLATSAAALRRAGLVDEGAQVFGELLERAPGDPWTLAYVGDRLRAERLFVESVVVCDQLARLMPDDAGVGLRLALAHAGAGRLDVATRLLQGVASTGGREDDGRLGDLAAILQAVLLTEAVETSSGNTELLRRMSQTTLPDVASVVVVQSPPSDNPVRLRMVYASDEKAAHTPNFDASPMGLNAALIERGASDVEIKLERDLSGDPVYPGKTRVYVLTSHQDGPPTLQLRELTVGNGAGETLSLVNGVLQ